MAQAAMCYGCGQGIADDIKLQRCIHCNRAFHHSCAMATAAMSTGKYADFICAFGCLQAFEAGKRQRTEGQHRCTTCQKAFSTSSNLQQHIKTAHMHKRYGPCPCCTPGRSFTSKQRLKLHVQARKGEIAKAISELN